jgi:hypothetical protein
MESREGILAEMRETSSSVRNWAPWMGWSLKREVWLQQDSWKRRCRFAGFSEVLSASVSRFNDA